MHSSIGSHLAPARPLAAQSSTSVQRAALLLSLLTSPGVLAAQVTVPEPAPPVVLIACWVPASGTVYRVDPTGQTPGMPKACLSVTHKQFEWNQQGPKGDAGGKGDTGPQGDPGPKGDPGPAGSASLPVFRTNFYDLSGPTGPSSGFVAQGALGQGSTDIPLGAGVRLLWYPRKLAFRAGGVGGSQWDDANVGESSFAGGRNTQASGVGSTALGFGAVASGTGSTALGQESVASGVGALAAGVQNTASGESSVSFGARSVASGFAANALGVFVTASGRSAFAAGERSDVSGRASFSLGFDAHAGGDYSGAAGYSTIADAHHSFAIGSLVSANGKLGSMLLGDGQGGQTTGASAVNEFTGRFANGYRFLLNADDLSQGCSISNAARLSCSGGVNMGLTRTTGARLVIGAFGTRKEFQSCPAGTQIVGGGTLTSTGNSGNGEMTVIASYPDFNTNRWYGDVRNTGLGSGEMQLFAVCVPI